ncbi:hypothetical protein [Rhizobium lusitanum]|uniref:hypothetical protein n=1 Tax=Rhizobium lusitanum TaxID=293958 RepID=UPI00195E6C40|nr:hypothetical protein [Rhizobium lusitanum]MBM7045212.1 hypothetical protein [Rhizobium lusitanum]
MTDSLGAVYANKRQLRAGSVIVGLLGRVIFGNGVPNVSLREAELRGQIGQCFLVPASSAAEKIEILRDLKPILG